MDRCDGVHSRLNLRLSSRNTYLHIDLGIDFLLSWGVDTFFRFFCRLLEVQAKVGSSQGRRQEWDQARGTGKRGDQPSTDS